MSTYAAVPALLKDIPHWVVWKHEVRDGKSTKVPYNAKGDGAFVYAKVNDSSTWSDFKRAVDTADILSGNDYDGIGFMLHGTNLVGFDFDGVLQDGKAESFVLDILEKLGNPYCEITPSGNGLRAFVECFALPARGRKFTRNTNGKYGAEIYSGSEGGRYLTVTGNHFSGNGIPKIADISLVYFMVSQITNDRLKSLWMGDLSKYDGDESRADLALAGILARLFGNAPHKIEWAFSASNLGKRDKWTQRKDYRDRTIARAISDDEPKEPAETRQAPEPGDEPDTGVPKLFQFAQRPSELSDKPIEWIIEGMFPKSSLSIVCGREGIGKGINALLSLGAILCGSVFLGRRANPVSHILYVDMENSEAVVRDRLAKLGLLESKNFMIWGQWNSTPPPTQFDDPMYWDYARKTGGFIYFDSLIDFCNGADENNAAEMNEALTKARMLARHCAGVHIQHHSDKYGKSGWRGTTAITAAVDMAFGLRAADDEAFRRGTNREICFSTLKPKMCEPYHINYEVVGWDGQLAYRIVPDDRRAAEPEPQGHGVKTPTKLEAAVEIGRIFITSRLEREQPVSVGEVKSELERQANPERIVRDAVKILRAQFGTFSPDNRRVMFGKAFNLAGDDVPITVQ